MLTIPPLAEATLWFALILALTAGFFHFVRKLAGRIGQDRLYASEMLTKFREVHARGGLSDAEYRTIKTKLAPELLTETVPEPEVGSDEDEPGPSFEELPPSEAEPEVEQGR